ncbi:MAG: hypothetical protein NVS3B12_32700 [Acidimicrobiales bacterium]
MVSVPVLTDLEVLLSTHPTAWVAAMGPDLVYVPMPDGLPVGGHPVLGGRWTLDHVAPRDRGRLAAAWRGRLDAGGVSVSVGLVTGGTATLRSFDLVESHGVSVVVAIPENGADLTATLAYPAPALSSRFCRMRRDVAGRVIWADPVAAAVLGWPGVDVTTRDAPMSYIHPDDHATVLDNWMATLADATTGHRCQARSIRADGSWMWVELTNYNHLDDPDAPYVESEVLDISVEMAANDAVRARERFLHRLAAALPVGVVQLGRDRHILYRNDYLTGILGNEEATTLEGQIASIDPTDRDMLVSAFDRAFDRGEEGEVTARVVGGVPAADRVVRVLTRGLADEDGTVTSVIACATDVTEVTSQRRELERRATFDMLTGCHNRSSVLSRLVEALHPAASSAGTAVIFVDLDHFKEINDERGHAVGDAVLRGAARILHTVIREGDTVGRLGGDEFLVLCRGLHGESQAMEVAARIADRLKLAEPIAISASVGVAWTSGTTADADRLVALADEAMYRSKREGRSQPHLAVAS